MSSDEFLNLPPPPYDKRLSYGADPNQFCELRLPQGKGPFGVVMNIHGGYWRAQYDLSHAGHLCAALTAKGFATCNVEYRRVGNKGGGWPGTLKDVSSAYRFLVQNATRYNIDANRLVVMGHSAGGHLALCLAAHNPTVSRLVSLAGVVDLKRAWELHLSNDAVVELLGGTPEQVPEHYAEADPMRLSIPTTKQWLIHGLADDVVPPEFSRNYVELKNKKNEKAHLLEIEKADHFDVINPGSPAWATVAETVKNLLLF